MVAISCLMWVHAIVAGGQRQIAAGSRPGQAVPYRFCRYAVSGV